MIKLSVLLLTLSVITTDAKKKYLRVIGGRDAEPNEFPYILRVDIEAVVSRPGAPDLIIPMSKCTASAITATWSLTAAHCVRNVYTNASPPPLTEFGMNSNNTYKIIGHLRSSVSNNEAAERGWLITSHVPYPGYRFLDTSRRRIGANVRNDIGLLRSEPMHLPSFARISAVDYTTLHGHEGNIAGYGLTQQIVNSELMINTTQKLKLPLQVLKIMIQKCDLRKWPDIMITPCVALARACATSGNVCPGDSGGPLLHPSGIVAVAVAGYSPDCSRKILSYRRPRSSDLGLYTPVSPYLDWILLQIKTA